jgi:adenosine deaminase
MTIDPHLPFIDLHRHLDGNVRLETILELGKRHGIELPSWDVEGLRPYVQVRKAEVGVMAFIARFKWMMAVLADNDACRRVAYENVEDAYQEGLDYVELRFSPNFMAETHQLNPIAVVEAVCDGVKAGQEDYNIRVNLIGIISRTYGIEAAWQELEALASQSERLTALDLAGDEVKYPAERFVEHFKRARDLGWQVTVHAGESAGPESIWAALKVLQADRIGHGVTAIQDPALMAYLAERQVGVECNLTSNVQTSTVSDYASHPMRVFLENGILATLYTDDPGISGIDLHFEYTQAAPKAGLSPKQIKQAQLNALDVAFLSKIEKELLMQKKRMDG